MFLATVIAPAAAASALTPKSSANSTGLPRSQLKVTFADELAAAPPASSSLPLALAQQQVELLRVDKKKLQAELDRVKLQLANYRRAVENSNLCRHCGLYHSRPELCNAQGRKCSFCGAPGHFARRCSNHRNQFVAKTDEAKEDELPEENSPEDGRPNDVPDADDPKNGHTNKRDPKDENSRKGDPKPKGPFNY